MGVLGRHLAITEEQLAELRRIADSDEAEDAAEEVWEAIQEIEEGLKPCHYFDTDKAWDPIHRALTLDNTADGRLEFDAGDYPFCDAFLSEDQLCHSDEFILSVIARETVCQLASALADVEEAWLRKRFFSLNPKHTEYGVDEDEFDYLWSNFHGLPEFFARAAAEGRVVLFTVAL